MNIEILTDEGFSSFQGVKRSFSYNCVNIHFEDNTFITATKDHRFFIDSEEVIVKNLKTGDVIDPNMRITLIEETYPQYVYDVLETNNHKFMANGIVSHNCEFLGSSGTLISGDHLRTLQAVRPIYQSNDKKMRQYETPKPGRNYFLSADVSRGKGIDYSAFSVIDVTEIPYRQVFVFRDNLITPTDFADVIMHVGTMYNEASVLVEINDLGQQVADYLHEMEYENIIYTATKGRKGKVLSVDGSSNIDRGLRTTKPVKNVGCSNLKLLVEQEKLKIVDEHTIAELSVFSKSGQSYQAEPGKHDDLVMGLVIFSWATVQQLFKDMFDTDVMASLREKSEEQMMEDLVPFGFIEDGHDEFAGYEDQGPIDVDDFEGFMRN